MTVKPVHC